MAKTNAALKVDLIIVGGGMVGATFACAVAHFAPQLSIALVDAVSASDDLPPGFDSRAIALSYGSAQLLQQIGLWAEFSAQVTPIRQIHVSDRGHSGMVHLSAQQEQIDALGYVIELANAGDILNQRLARLPQLTWIRPDSIESLHRSADLTHITLASGTQLAAPLLVGADGGHSRCRQLLNLQQVSDDYGTSAIIANVVTSQLHQGRAFERFTNAGPLALLPMSDNRSALVWSVHNHQLDGLMALSDDAFRGALQQQFGFRLGTFTRIGERVAYPLSLTQSPMPVSHRSVLIGNAAHTLHPVAGQGYNLGLRDLFVLAQGMINASDIGAFASLDAYWQQRESDHQRTILMTDLLARTFANDHWPLVAARNTALHLMDSIDLLKQPLSHQALGHFERAGIK